jgi:D-3-phosphoglycerate dehydrogenase
MPNKPKVLFLDTVHPVLNEELKALNYECILYENMDGIPVEKIIHEYHGIVLRSKIKLDSEILSKATKLKFIGRAGAGMENIDVKYAESMGIACLNAPEGNRDAVADHAIGMILSLFKKIPSADTEVRRGIWQRESNRGIELTGKTVGIIGYGFTGTAIAKRLQGFDVNVYAYDKYKSGFANEHIKESTLEEVFEKTDILSLHLPLTKETYYMIDDDFINKFKKDIYLINTSRGKVVKTADLVKNLKSGKIKGACLDVLEYESTSFSRLKGLGMWTNKRGLLINRIGAWLMKNGLWLYLHPVQYLVKCNNVLMSPHVAGWSYESYKKISLILAERIKELQDPSN